MRFVQPILTGILLSTVASGAFAQAQPADKKPPQQPQATKPAPASQKSAGADAKASAGKTPAGTKAGQAPAKPTAKPAAPAKSSQGPAKPAVKPPAKAAGKGPQVVGKKPTRAVKKAVVPGTTPPPAESETKIARRDPFESLIGRQLRQGQALPAIPGKPGLVIATLRVDGIVRTPDLMIAIVTNPQQRTYFLREGDQLFDGRVEKIMMDSVSFHEVGKDAFGKPVERQVNKRIYPSSGETQ
jgi:hypothetical protein